MELDVQPDAGLAAQRGAELIAEAAATAIEERGAFSLAASGGTEPWEMYRRLRWIEPDWDRMRIWQVDERVAPDGDPDRNLTHLLESLPWEARPRLQPMPVTHPDLDAAAREYAVALPPSLDLVHLGIGPDGHTASLVPGDPVLEADDRRVAVTGEYQGRRRMTLTFPELARARRILWLIIGESKREPLRRLLEGDRSIPAGRVEAAASVVVADRAAAPDR
jgi:6-phosphogluconolactonase